MHKFLLAENPQAPDTGGLWIIKLPQPVAIIEAVLDGEKTHSKNCLAHRSYQYCNADGVIEQWQLRCYYIAHSNADNEALLNDAWHWFRSYLTWEDKNIDTDEEANLN